LKTIVNRPELQDKDNAEFYRQILRFALLAAIRIPCVFAVLHTDVGDPPPTHPGDAPETHYIFIAPGGSRRTVLRSQALPYPDEADLRRL
jgi:hypothetical protein